jgi:hypothetical protein
MNLAGSKVNLKGYSMRRGDVRRIRTRKTGNLMKKTHLAAISFPVLLVLALAGCTGGGDGATGTDASTGDSEGSGSTACLIGKVWTLDVEDMAAQLAANLDSHGLNVSESHGEGTQTFTFDEDGKARSSVDLSYAITVTTDSTVMALTQTHRGDTGGEWAWLAEESGDSNVITFSNWDSSAYSVSNHIEVNGTASDAPISIPDASLGGTNMTVVCSGSTLSTKVEVSPFTQHWTAG